MQQCQQMLVSVLIAFKGGFGIRMTLLFFSNVQYLSAASKQFANGRHGAA